jgi:hypothetical protein
MPRPILSGYSLQILKSGVERDVIQILGHSHCRGGADFSVFNSIPVTGTSIKPGIGDPDDIEARGQFSAGTTTGTRLDHRCSFAHSSVECADSQASGHNTGDASYTGCVQCDPGTGTLITITITISISFNTGYGAAERERCSCFGASPE